MHHIISDGWSLGVLITEAGALYDAFTHARPSPLPELTVQYADFAVWQREWLQGDVLQAQLDYWEKQLGGVPTLELATDRPRPSTLSHRGAEIVRIFPKELVTGLRAVGKPENATLFMTLLAAFDALLYRYSGQPDVAVGTPIAGRTHSETEGLVGFFVNTLVLRADVSGNPSFRDLLGRVKQAVARGVRPPGPAVRADRGRPPPGPRPEPHAALPGHARPAERPLPALSSPS